MFENLWRIVEHAAEAVLVFLIAAMTVVCTMQVISRYVFNDPLIWTEELTRYLFVWSGYLSAWLAWKHRAHIAVDAVSYINSAGLKTVSARLVELLVFGFCAYTLYANAHLVSITRMQPSAVLEVPMSWVYLAYSVMAALIMGDILIGWFVRQPPEPPPVAEI